MRPMQKKERILWIIALSIFVMLWIFSSTGVLRIGKADDDLYKDLRLFDTILSLVQTTYVDKPNSRDLIYGAIDGMLASLHDPYTRFIRSKGYEELNIETKGKFGGVGFVITIRDGVLTVVTPIDGTPAARAGIKPNDKIIKINNTITKNMKLDEAVSKLRGKPGTEVTLYIEREGEPDLIKIKIKREIINIKSVLANEIDYKGKKIGYIKIKSFAENTISELEKTLKKYDKEKLDGLILDLRNNPGGLLYSAWKVADFFIDKGLIVYTKGRIPSQNKKYYASSIDYCHNVPMIILANGGSASGSEIVIGALKDNKRAIIVGEKTFGKGVVQSVRELGENRAVAITTARYYTPSGVCIHKKGIKPNIEVKPPVLSKKEVEIVEKILKGKYIDKFFKEHSNFIKLKKDKQKKLIEDLVKNLSSKGINADYNIVRRLVKMRAYEGEEMNKAIIDLEDDVQLKRAVELLRVHDRL